MTAEQALIEENKKDPRKKYITKDINGNTEFWSAKPFINNETGQWMAEGFLISIVLNDIEIDFSRKDWQECILCIDDIKQEIPPIPEKWYIECTENNRDILNDWRLKKCGDFYKDNDANLLVGQALLSQNLFDVSFCYAINIQSIKENIAYKNHQEITLDQFKKYVLCEGEEKQEEKTIENHPIMSIAESEREQSQKEEQLPKFLQEINKAVSDLLTPFESRKTWIEKRIKSINKGIEIYIEQLYCIPIEWVEERNELIEKLKNL